MTALVDACDRYGNPTVFKVNGDGICIRSGAYASEERLSRYALAVVILQSICPRAGSYVIHADGPLRIAFGITRVS